MEAITFKGIYIAIGVLVILFLSGIRILNEYERGVVFRLGRVVRPEKGPGLKWIIPFIDRMVRISTRIITADVPPQEGYLPLQSGQSVAEGPLPTPYASDLG